MVEFKVQGMCVCVFMERLRTVNRTTINYGSGTLTCMWLVNSRTITNDRSCNGCQCKKALYWGEPEQVPHKRVGDAAMVYIYYVCGTSVTYHIIIVGLGDTVDVRLLIQRISWNTPMRMRTGRAPPIDLVASNQIAAFFHVINSGLYSLRHGG